MATVRQCVCLNCFHIHVSLSHRLPATGIHRLTSKLQLRDATEDYWSPHRYAHTQRQRYPASPTAMLAYAIHMAGMTRNTRWLMFEVSSKRKSAMWWQRVSLAASPENRQTAGRVRAKGPVHRRDCFCNVSGDNAP